MCKYSYRGGGWGSHKVVGKGYINTENSQMESTGAIFTSTYHTKQLRKSMAKLISQLCGELQLAVYLSRGDGAI